MPGEWALVMVILAITVIGGAAIVRRNTARRRRQVGAANFTALLEPAPPNSAAAGPRVIRRSQSPAASGRVRVVANGAPVRNSPSRRHPGSARGQRSTDPTPPAHALCTWCSRPFSTDRTERDRRGMFHCPTCGSYSHRDCYERKQRRCGGICAL